MRFKPMLLAVLATGICSVAQAQSGYSASFSLTDPIALSHGPDAAGSVGQWSTYGWYQVFIDRGMETRYSMDTFGVREAYISGANFNAISDTFRHDSAETFTAATVDPRSLSAAAHVKNDYYSTGAGVNWVRPFELNAHSSLTVSGRFTVFSLDELSPPLSSTPFILDHDEERGDSLSFENTNLNFFFRGRIVGANPEHGHVEYAFSDDGWVSATFTNLSDAPLSAGLSAHLYANAYGENLMAAVPEPSTFLSMLLGLGIVSGIALRRRKERSSAATPGSNQALA